MHLNAPDHKPRLAGDVLWIGAWFWLDTFDKLSFITAE